MPSHCFRDALIVAIGDTLTAIFGGIVIFGIIGYMAHELQVPIEKVATQGKTSSAFRASIH